MVNVTKSYGDLWYWPALEVRIAVIVVLALVILIGIVGNIVVLLLIALDKSMHTTVNRCLFVLAIADLLLLIFLPILPINFEFLEDDSHLGANMCYFLFLFDRGAVSCSAMIFVFVSVDRYFAICHPLKIRHFWSGRNTYIVLAIIWILAIATSIPYAYMTKYESKEGNSTRYFCRFDPVEKWQIYYDTASNILMSLAPIPVLVSIYGRMIIELYQKVPGELCKEMSPKSGRQGRIKVMRLMLTVVTIFIVCQVPFSLLTIIDYHSPYIFTWANNNDWTYALTWVASILSYVNSAANPVVYFIMSSSFRRAFARVFCCARSERRGWRSTSTSTTQMYSIESRKFDNGSCQ